MSNVPRKNATTVTIRHTFQSAFNEIVGTNHVGLSHYFIAHWLPKISANGLKILVQLRSQGYYNPKAQVTRGEIDIEQADLAKLIGISTKTIQRAFAEDEVLCKYVQRVFQVKRNAYGRIVKEHYVYVVVMDDVLTPEDKARFDLMLQEPDKPSLPLPASTEPPNGQNVPSGDASTKVGLPPKRQKVASAGQSVPPKRQSDALGRQKVSLYNKVNLTLLTEDNTSLTPVAAPEDLASLFEEEDKDLEQAPTRRWQDLTQGEQQPFVDQARAELIAIHAGTGITPKPILVEVRAVNLYDEAQKGGGE